MTVISPTLVDRVKKICLSPNSEWQVIADESASTGSLIGGYVAPLAAVGAVAGFIGGSIVGYGTMFFGSYRVPLVAGLSLALYEFVAAIVGVFILSFLINALAPTFGAQANSSQALKVAVYSYTPAWAAGVLRILPAFGALGVIAALYGLYLLYLGLQKLMKAPQEKAVGYTVVVVVAAIVLAVVIGSVGAMVTGAGMLGYGSMGRTARSSTVQFDPNSSMGKLQQLSTKLEESNKKAEEARKRGDANGQANAAIEGLGTLLGGGKRVDPLGIEQLKPMLPETVAGLARRSSNAEKSGIVGLMVSKAEATYGDGADKSVRLEITDTGGVSGMMGFAAWANVQGEKEDDNGSERTVKEGGRLVHEKISKRGGSNEFSIVIGDRFVVTATGRGVDIAQLKAAVAALDLAKLEAMKDIGVQK